MEQRPLVFNAAHHGMRLDRALVDMVPEFSRSYLQQLIDLGRVWLNGRVLVKASHRVRAADTGLIELRPTPQSQAFKAEAMALDVVYVDAHLLVINKPAGLVVHPAPGNWAGTLMNGLLAYDAKAFDLPRAGIVHRLDKDTSGLMVVARTRSVMDALVRAIAAREVKRQYLAIGQGHWSGALRCVVDVAIGRDPVNRLRMAAVDLSLHPGKAARTDFDLLANADRACLVQCTLHTGRTHQIRVHMAKLAHPLAGDALYGGSMALGIQRQALHAYRLAFVHPVTGLAMDFSAVLPDDFSQALNPLGLKYNREIL
ncbi:RluA family pseudouridine synthase [Rhodoferax sp.]|uniref:RluA family pseudouridine synthase n=1 Tax=Rhodoferax sp. TaxID=50421 RepID=UPI00261409E2|nr:RluA family pseudouridine synthase [Rhodoferax sp.]MDD2919575.1 RluA family pseudouridine synthase [Rhodoferax sp.]